MRAGNWIPLFAMVASGMGPATAFALGEDCEFRNAAVDAAGVAKVVVLAGAGDLKVRGNADARRIDAHGIACAGSKAVRDQLQVSVRRDGNVVYVETHLPQGEGSWGKNPYIDLGVTLPGDIPVEATDSSGDADFADLKSLTVQDSSGDLTLMRIAGAVDVGDSSGDIEIEKVGSVRVRDSSGDIDVDDVRQDVVVESDSSGDIEIEEVTGSVTVEDDSSGGIRVTHVKGDFTVRHDGSGGIEHSAIGGKVSVPRED